MRMKKILKMKDRILSFVLALAMVVPAAAGIMPTAVSAASIGTGYVKSKSTRYVTHGSLVRTDHEFTVVLDKDNGQTITKKATCMQHGLNCPDKGDKITKIEVVSNDNLRKVLYYGCGGPKDTFLAAAGKKKWTADDEKKDGPYAVAWTYTSEATSIAYNGLDSKYNNGEVGSKVLDGAVSYYNKVIKYDAPPDNFKVYKLTTDSKKEQDLCFWEYDNEYGKIQIQKTSDNTVITQSNSCYSLKGAEYGVYYDSKLTNLADTIITDEKGTGTSKNLLVKDSGSYYVKELKASPGHDLDTKTYTVKLTANAVKIVKSMEPTLDDPAGISLTKISSDGEGNIPSLEGTQFTVDYYAGLYTKDNLPSKATRSWVLQIKKNSNGQYRTALANSYKVSGDEFYYRASDTEKANPILPLGTIRIRETKAASGYTLDGGYLLTQDGKVAISDMKTGAYVAQIKSTNDGVVLQGGNQFTVANDQERGDFHFIKKDEENQKPMANIPFKITSLATGESHTVMTDANGIFSTASSHNKHSSDTNGGKATSGVWFGGSKVDDSKGALPLGTYTVEELKCSANEGKKLAKFNVVISKVGEDVDMGTVFNPDVTLRTIAKDEESNTHYAIADDEVTIVDSCYYTGLEKGKTYTLTATLMDKAAGSAVKDASGKTVTATKTFKPSASEGIVEIDFTFDASKLAGHDVVVFEKVSLDKEVIVTHEDINDEDQTLHFPEIGTKATDGVTDSNIAKADKEITIVDTVSYKNLRVGKTYTVTGTLMDKETGKAVKDASGENVTAEAKFKAETANGSVKVTFKFDGSNLAGHTLVAFETLENQGKTYAVHADINDEDQTVHIPEIKTTALDKDSETQNSLAQGQMTIVDTVSYKNLVPGKEYTMKGVLMNKKTGEALEVNGEKIISEVKFTPEKADGTVEMTFTFDGHELAGETLVVFEDCLYNGFSVAAHADIEDEGQTIYIPEIGTTALDKASGTHNALAGKNTTVIDTVEYKNLIPGKEYTVKGKLIDIISYEPIKDATTGKDVVAETKFTPEKSDGKIDMIFTFDASGLENDMIVAFEEVYINEKLVGIHAEVTDEKQTIYFPELHTTAVDKSDGDHKLIADGKVTIVDTVEYSNVIPGQSYKVTGTLMDKDTGKPLLTEKGKKITAEAEFTAEDVDGMIDVEFTFDGTGLGGKTAVAFEDLSINDVVVGTHADISDEAQTVKLITPARTTKTGDDNSMMLIAAGAGAVLLLAGIGFVASSKKRKRKHE